MRAKELFVVILTLSVLCQGCGIFSGIGAGIGAGVPRYADLPVPRVPIDSDAEAADPEPASDGTTQRDDAAAAVTVGPTARRRVGSHWAEGLGIGLVVDIALTIAATAVVVDINSHPWMK